MTIGKQQAVIGKQLVSIPTGTQKAADKICAVEKLSIYDQKIAFKGTVSPYYQCLEVISIKSPLLGHVTPDNLKIFKLFLLFLMGLQSSSAHYTKHIPILLFTGT